MLLDEIMKKLDEKKDRIIEIRRYLHEHPELSFQEEETAKYISDFYKDVSVDSVETNFGGERGIVVTIKGPSPVKRSPSVPILMRSPFRKKPVFHLHRKMME